MKKKKRRKRTLNPGGLFHNQVKADIGTANPAFAFAYPVLDKEGRPKAVLTAAIKLDIFSGFYEISTLPEKAFVAVTDYKGTRLFYYPPQDNTNPIGKPIGAKAWNTASKGEEHGLFFGAGSDGLDRIFAYEKIRLNQEDTPYLYVWAGIPEDYILKTANSSLVRNLLIMFLGTVISLFISWMIGKKTLISPIQSLVALTRKFAQGDLEARSELTTNAGEVGMLTRAFYDMAESLAMSRKTLKESETKFRSMMEAMKDPIYICSLDFQVEYMNPAMIRRVGHDATGEFCFKCLHDLNEKCAWCQHDIIQRGTSSDLEIVSPKDNRSYLLSQTPIVHGDGSISKMTVYKDITDLRSMEAQFRQAQKMEAIGTLAGGIAHDFNNILFPIVGYAEMILMDTPDDSPIRDSLNQIYTSALRAKSLVKQILTFSRQENHELILMKMQPLIKEALKLIRSTIPTTIEIKQDINPDCGVIKADPTQIHQIVMNLATNAYHAMEETGGELKVSLKEMELGTLDLINPNMVPGVYVCLIVADTGVGMDKNLTDKIFDPFFTTKAIGKGTGMGLSVVHGIVTAMGGAIHVYSEPGKGTQFHVYLPVEKSSPEEQVSHSTTEIQGGTEQILLVDDEEAILSMEKRMLERLGYQVTSRSSSLEALEAFHANPDKFDLIITDMAMPNMAGDKLAVELTKIRTDIPVLLCTGFSQTMSEEKAATLGIKGFLLKPIVMKDLAQKIRDVLE